MNSHTIFWTSNGFIFWWSNSYTLFFASTEQISNLIDPSLDLLNFSSNRLEHCFSNTERTWTCLASGNRTWTPCFWLQTIQHQTSNIVRPITSFPQPKASYSSTCIGILYLYTKYQISWPDRSHVSKTPSKVDQQSRKQKDHHFGYLSYIQEILAHVLCSILKGLAR